MQVDRLAPLPDPGAPPRVLTWAQARSLGYTAAAIAHRVARGDWRKILPRVYLTSDTLMWSDRLHAAIAYAGDGALLSGAAALCDLELRSVRRPQDILVLVPPTNAVSSTSWVRVRPSSRASRRALLPGPPRADVARAVADLAVETRWLDDVRALVTEAVRRRMCTPEELAVELAHGPQRGSAHLRQAITEAAGGAWSAPEARAATLLRRAGVPAFEQNARIGLPDGRYVIVDFLWRQLAAVLEIDSLEHHSLPGDADRTSRRHLLLETIGLSVVHRTPRYVTMYPEGFVDGIAAWLDGLARRRRSS